eukprot:766883-Hanusia_phi.AAC.7
MTVADSRLSPYLQGNETLGTGLADLVQKVQDITLTNKGTDLNTTPGWVGVVFARGTVIAHSSLPVFPPITWGAINLHFSLSSSIETFQNVRPACQV